MRGLLFENQISPHTTARKIFDAFVVFGPIRMSVEMARTTVSNVFKKFDEPECGYQIRRAEAQVLIVASRNLIVKVNMKKFSCLPRLRDRVHHVQSGHLLVRNFRVHSNHLRVIERFNQSKISARRWKVNVSARLVRLGFESELVIIILRERILAKIVERLTETLDGFIRPSARVRLNTFAPTPQNENLRAEFSAQIHRAHCLLHSVGSHSRVVSRESSVAERWAIKEIDRRHRNFQPRRFARALKLAHNPVTLLHCCINRHKIVVMQIDSHRTNLCEHSHSFDRRERRTNSVAKRIASTIAYGPESESEFMLRARSVCVRHGYTSSKAGVRIQNPESRRKEKRF